MRRKSLKFPYSAWLLESFAFNAYKPSCPTLKQQSTHHSFSAPNGIYDPRILATSSDGVTFAFKFKYLEKVNVLKHRVENGESSRLENVKSEPLGLSLE
ncbi:hypothetical protein L596_023529 [Steinernema carpocapsae]|uniref:Uncharacterized protein n=1 Tax=Steinernema carpocapsae TaxID=34508 RepID=A0A4U5MDX1_STECR|nr:hypothetical protein L596_023529 [Steinernema carpocapsae]